MPEVITFSMGVLDERGTMNLSREGHCVVRALVMKWIEEALNGEIAAKEMDKLSPNPFGANQSAYFRSARSFLVARLVSHLTSKIKIGKWVKELTEWDDGQPYPPEWESLEQVHKQMGGENVIVPTTTGERGTDCGGCDIPTPLDNGLVGKERAATAPPGASGHDTREGRVSDGPETNKPRTVGTDKDSRRGGLREPSGKTARQAGVGRNRRGKTPPTE